MQMTGEQNPFGRELTPKEQSEYYTADFFGGLIDGFDYLNTVLYPVSDHIYRSEGFTSTPFEIPDFLEPYLGLDLYHYPERAEVSTDIQFSICKDSAIPFLIETMTIHPEDRPPVVLQYENEVTNIYQNDEIVAAYDSESAMFQAARELMSPHNSDMTTIALKALSINSHSPLSIHIASFKQGNIYIQTTESETRDDSMKEVYVRYIGKRIGSKTLWLEAVATENIKQALRGTEFKRETSLETGRIVDFNEFELIDGDYIKIETPRKSHAKILRKTLEKMIDSVTGKNSYADGLWTAKLD
jgi:hypothetical protein